MDNFDVAIHLIQRAQKEHLRIKRRKKEYEEAAESGTFTQFWKKWGTCEPHKQIVNDSLKIARQLLLEVYEK